MPRILFAALALCLFALPALAGEPAVAETSMDAVEKGLADKSCTVFDANSAATRTEHGALVGAVLLDSYSEYALSVLPADKASELVFYCGSTKCTASDKAAVRAQEAGYSKVSVMREGIKGWKAAGKATVPVGEPTDKS